MLIKKLYSSGKGKFVKYYNGYFQGFSTSVQYRTSK